MSLFPMFLKLEGRRCLVVGAGRVGEPKIASLLATGAEIHVIAPRATKTVARWARARQIHWEERRFAPADLDGIFLVVAATSSAALNQQIFHEARRRNVLCNAVDDPEHCDFYYPAVVRRGQLQIAISTGGQSPALAQRLRTELEQQFGPRYEPWVEKLGAARRRLFTSRIAPARRKRLLHQLASRASFEASAHQPSSPPGARRLS